MIDEIGALLGPLLGTLERVGWVQRHLYPPMAARLADEIAPCVAMVSAPLRVLDTGRQTVELVTAFVEAAKSPEDLIGLFRAIRRFARVQETLYPLAVIFEPVSRWFLDPAHRDDTDLLERLRAGALREGDLRVGVMHADNERGARGGFSVYVPEIWDGRSPLPLVVALHGGSGHGRDFLWSWVAAARAHGALVAAPTARDRTWSLMGPDVDAEPLRAMVESLAARYPVDRERVLLTGMSDGATYALLHGLRDGGPFTHLAALCGVLHPMLLASGDIARAKDRPIYLVHGALDWMFPVAAAQMARGALESVGARVVYREIEDLSHTYPRDENPAILTWMGGARRAPQAPPRA